MFMLLLVCLSLEATVVYMTNSTISFILSFIYRQYLCSVTNSNRSEVEITTEVVEDMKVK